MTTRTLKTSALITAALTLAAGSATAATLVFDDFDGGSGTNLVGTTADVGGVWTGSGNTDMKADGSFVSGGERTAYQAVTINTGTVYTLSADITRTTASNTGNFIGIGFANSPGDGIGAIWSDANPYAWMYVNQDNFGIRRILGVNLNGEVEIADSPASGTPVELKVVLDTTNASNYEVTWFVDGVEEDSAFIGSAPALTHVFVNKHSGVAGSVDNFTLTEVPEPGSLALMGLGGLLIARRRRG